MVKIKHLSVKRLIDDQADLSYLGTFSDNPDKYAIEQGTKR